MNRFATMLCNMVTFLSSCFGIWILCVNSNFFAESVEFSMCDVSHSLVAILFHLSLGA